MPAHIEMSTNSPSFVFSEGVGLALFIIISTLWKIGYQKLHEGERHGYDKLVGQTPLLELRNISGLLGRKIFVKLESMNPGGTGKDRAVQQMLDEAEKTGELKPGMTVFEGTSGSTGIALAFQCLARGYKLHVVMPDDQAEEKRRLLENLGAQVTIVPCCSIANQDHYVNTARRMAIEHGGFFCNQFENTVNSMAHYCRTGPEIWNQMNGDIDAFIMSSGTGGTIAGVSRYLKERNPKVLVYLADPTGSSLRNKVLHNVCYTTEQAERRVKKHRYDSIVEGVGLDRITKNFALASIDGALTLSDQDLTDMAHALLHLEGLFVGSSSALNLGVACRVASLLPPNSRVVTVICDHGSRHLSRFWSRDYITNSAGLRWPPDEYHSKSEWEAIIKSISCSNM